MINLIRSKLLLICMFGLFAGCDSGSSGGGTSGLRGPIFEVSIVVPSDRSQVGCGNVPVGYKAVTDATVRFRDSTGGIMSGIANITDDCGMVRTSRPVGSESIIATSSGNRVLVTDISAIVDSGHVASTIPSTSDYSIGFLRLYDDGSVGFSVTDTVSQKAVIGLSRKSFNLEYDQAEMIFNTVRSALQTEEASITLILDASGSMGRDALTSELADDGTILTWSRRDIATLAAHQYLDEKNATDEVSVMIFDVGSHKDFLDQSTIDDIFSMVDADGNPTQYTLTEDGYTADSKKLRLLVDAYNDKSDVWQNGTQSVLRHVDTPEGLSLISSYRWDDGTAFFDSVVVAVEQLGLRQSARKFVIAMTDGDDTDSSGSKSSAIQIANENGVGVYIIGFELTSDDGPEAIGNLEDIAEQTGATFFKADSLDLAGAYQSIQTNIQYQYTGTPSVSLPTDGDITLNLVNPDGTIEATRTVMGAGSR